MSNFFTLLVDKRWELLDLFVEHMNMTTIAVLISLAIGVPLGILICRSKKVSSIVIGIANVFSNTLGFLTQRKREFAQYMSVGMTPAGIRKMFFVEALVIAGRPLLITLPLTVAFVQFAAAASHLNPSEFWAEAPIIPILIFCLAIFVFVALAYYIGGKRLLRCNLSEALRNDTIT